MTMKGVLGAAFRRPAHRSEPADVRTRRKARRRGADIATNTRVTGVAVDRGRVTGVKTDRGSIETEVIVNAGGMYARDIGALAGVDVPIVPMAREYLITKPAALPLDMPTMRDPSLLVLPTGVRAGWSWAGTSASARRGARRHPHDFNSRLLEEDWPRPKSS